MDKHTIAVEPESAVPAAVRGSCVSDGVHTSLDCSVLLAGNLWVARRATMRAQSGIVVDRK